MKNPRAALVATAIPLLLTALRVTAGELSFNAPATGQARESASLLRQAAHALHDSTYGVSGAQISHLWLFPTADAHTVFARYNLTSGHEGTSGLTAAITEHLAVLTVDGNRILESRELTDSTARFFSKHSASLDWSANIGTGHAVQADTTNPTRGLPASPHWTASIGTGSTVTPIIDSGRARQPSSSNAQPVVAIPHWTSRIGRGDAVASTRATVDASLANAR
jgi:hypothetical protein